MILYHFCAAHMLPSIMKEGLTLGRWPIIGYGLQTWPKCQWLTQNPDPKEQSWATKNLISYDRTAYRLTVRIPDNYQKKLVRARVQMMNVPPKDRSIITEWPGSDDWYVYLGNIPPQWIDGCRKMEGGSKE